MHTPALQNTKKQNEHSSNGPACELSHGHIPSLASDVWKTEDECDVQTAYKTIQCQEQLEQAYIRRGEK